jgi:hypothetical protein
MSLRLQQPVPPVPDDTARIARAAFPRGNPYLLLRDRLGPVFDDAGFADLYPRRASRRLELHHQATTTHRLTRLFGLRPLVERRSLFWADSVRVCSI